MSYGFQKLFYKIPKNLIDIEKLIQEAKMPKSVLDNMRRGGLEYIPIFEKNIVFSLKRLLSKINFYKIGGILIAQSVPFKINLDIDIPIAFISGQPCAIMHLGLELAEDWQKNINKDILIIGIDKALSANKRLYFNSAMGDIIIAGILSNKNIEHKILSSHIDSYIFADNGELSKEEDIVRFRTNNPLLIRKNIFDNLQKSNLDLKDIKYIFPHTPYLQIWDVMSKVLHYPREKIITNYINRTGHLNSNDSFFHYLKAIEEGIVNIGDRVLLINNGFGGSRGSTIIEYKGHNE